jgi:hypothetical protein
MNLELFYFIVNLFYMSKNIIKSIARLDRSLFTHFETEEFSRRLIHP